MKCSAELQAELRLSSRGYGDEEVLLEGWRHKFLMNSVVTHAQEAENTELSR